ncbi:nucleotidyltransferase family protein [Allohahella marinimesophila]
MLAAGSARRFGAAKLLAPLAFRDTSEEGAKEITLIEVAIASLKGTPWPIFVAVREDDDALRALLAEQNVQVLPVSTRGMGDTIAAGLRALLTVSQGCPEAVGIALADMPLLTPCLHRELILHADGDGIVRPVHTPSGRVGHPVIFGRRYFAQLERCSGDSGAQSIVASVATSIHLVPTISEGCLVDIDTPTDLQRAQQLFTVPT